MILRHDIDSSPRGYMKSKILDIKANVENVKIKISPDFNSK